MSEIDDRMTYLEQQLAQVKSIVAHGSEMQDKPANRCAEEKNQTIKSFINSKISSNDKPISKLKPRSQIIKLKADIQPNTEENMERKTAKERRDHSLATSNLWCIDVCPSGESCLPEIESNNGSKRKDKIRFNASDPFAKERKLKRKTEHRKPYSSNAHTNIGNSNAQKPKEKLSVVSAAHRPQRKMLAEYWKPVDELEWAKNLFLIGDIFWNSFVKYAKIKTKIAKMEQLYTGQGNSSNGNFRLLVRRENEMIGGLYDAVRGKLLFPLPPRIKMVCISIGAHDILNVAKLSKDMKKSEENKTSENKDETALSSSNEIAKIFGDMADSIKNMVRKLHNMNKSVLLLVPYSNENLELFDMWQNLIKETTTCFLFPAFRVLNLSEIMKSTSTEFESPQEMFESWIADKNGSSCSLSEYGCVRLFHALEEAIISARPGKTESLRLSL